jgi:beta-xylosidase
MYASKLLLVAGTLQAGLIIAYQNPIQKPGPDPSMVYANGMYYLTHTGYNHIGITRSKTLAGPDERRDEDNLDRLGPHQKC